MNALGQGGPPPTAARPQDRAVDWIARRWFTASGALVAEAAAGLEPLTVFRHASGLKHSLFLDSAAVDRPDDDVGTLRLGRFSFVTGDPIHSVALAPGTDPAQDASAVTAAFGGLRGLLRELACPTIPGLPPFQGGVAGLVSYECGLTRLGLAPPATRATAVPMLSLHAYDVVFAYDHDLGRGWFISQGLPATGPEARRIRGAARLAAWLAAEPVPHDGASSQPMPAATAAIRHPLPGHPLVRSTHSRDAYCDMVRAAIELIRAGDIFQVNLAQCLAVEAAIDPVELHLRARTVNPAPFACFFDTGTAAIASMSPERFLQAARGDVRTHPIKGTRRVISSPEADLFAGDDLQASAKDRAENVMIVDLLRNDLSRVCTPASVRVEALCRLERYRYVQHLVSVVAGRLRPGLGVLDALEAAMPGGSVTGAPKHRACEIISAFEPVAREAYCGSIGYVGFDGTADFNLLIRTFVTAQGRITFSAGGGVTAASDPAAEHAESLHKAEGMLRVLESLGIGSGAES
jgi:para-aminobenzoate synthetase component 1